MGKITNENYFVVHGWMRNLLNLRGNALDMYAIIYGFSQTDHQEYTASISYMAEWLGVSKPTVINTLKDLVDRGLLTKKSEEINGVIFNRYRAVVPNLTSGKKILQGSKEILQDSKEILPNKENIKKDIKKKSKTIVLESGAPVKSYGDIFKAPEYSQIAEALRKFITQCKGMNYTPQIATVKKWADLLVVEGKNSPEYAMRIVNQSIDKGWKALYPLKGYSGEAVSIPSSEDRLAKDAQGNNIVF